ncbi:MAG TPA: hypothetical protein VJQ85_04480 [Gaiellaceae bacterium]|nr:hypothetical protein [Gaiellaceae bacterium]
MSDADEIVRLVIERVQAQIDAQLAADDAVDLKALGVLAAIFTSSTQSTCRRGQDGRAGTKPSVAARSATLAAKCSSI